jgi:hypothetical protein
MPSPDADKITEEVSRGAASTPAPAPRPILDYATPRWVLARVRAPHALYRIHRAIATNGSADWVTLAYCLIVLIVGGIFRMFGVIFVDAGAKK